MSNHESTTSASLSASQSGKSGSPSVTSNSRARLREPRTWRGTLIRNGPLSGLFGLGLALTSIIASAGILVGSDRIAVSSWTTPPSTYLAIFTAIANLAMRYACIQGVIIAWWNRALSGASLSRLHHDWRSGTTIIGALTSGSKIGLLGLACISSTFVVIDGPLLQRATSVESTPIVDHTLPLSVSMAPIIPTDFSGAWFKAKAFDIAYGADQNWNATVPTYNGSAPNDVFSDDSPMFNNHVIYRLWTDNSPLPGVITGCPQGYGKRCRAKLRAPALATIGCTPHSVQVDYKTPMEKKTFLAMQKNVNDPGPLNSFAFMVSVGLLLEDDEERINIVTGFSQTQNCSGQFQYTACTLESAIGEYDVSITGNALTLDSPAKPKIIASAGNVQVNHSLFEHSGVHPSTLGGLVAMANSKWSGSYQLEYWQGGMIGQKRGQTYREFTPNLETNCPLFEDPYLPLMASLNQLMVYAGASAAKQDPSALHGKLDPGLDVNSTIAGTLDADHNVFVTDYYWFVGAALVEIICITLVLPTYWAWWRIGRPMSFSPLEMAKAFQSPLVSDQYSNSSARELAKATEEREVKYGVVYAEEGGTRLAFAESSFVSRPQTRSAFDA